MKLRIRRTLSLVSASIECSSITIVKCAEGEQEKILGEIFPGMLIDWEWEEDHDFSTRKIWMVIDPELDDNSVINVFAEFDAQSAEREIRGDSRPVVRYE